MTQLEEEEVPALPSTGERMIPEASDDGTFWEHVYRYRFAVRYAPGKRVLDIACGEGYGSSALLKAGALSLIGVDVSPETCEHARRKYGVDARVGDAQDIPLPDDSVDLVVSFETIEHIPEPARFIDECARVLAPGGIFVVSTPNRDIYRELTPAGSNPYHCSEMDLREFESFLKPRFRNWSIYIQAPKWARWYSPVGLTLDRWYWWKVGGVGRLKWRAHEAFGGKARRGPTAEQRLAPQGLILGDGPPMGWLFNPFAVRPRSRMGGEDPLYLLAVAHV